jgi:hypothetical protein
MGEIKQVLKKKKKILFVFKGYTCRFKSEAFASYLLLYWIEIDHTWASYNYDVILHIKYYVVYPQLRNEPEF